MEQYVSSNNQAGFTLIEFCVAVVIMMVGLLGLLQAVNMTTVHNLGNLLRNEAISMADEQMVLVKASVYDEPTFAALATTASLVNRKTRTGFNNYSVVRIVPTPSTSLNSKEVLLRVSWRHKGNKLNHMISSIVTNPTPL